jgi:NADH:quinone reductase (non-electrogenic)
MWSRSPDRTRGLICVQESPIHQNVKERIAAADERMTQPIFRALCNTSRVARNSTSEQVVDMESHGGS